MASSTLRFVPDVASPDNDSRDRYGPKIRECCILAELHGYRWVWIDTCCIDKASSAELSEAINSMYIWYEQAGLCLAYLYDVSSVRDGEWQASLDNSRWFTRGWTLQELIAPNALLFVAKDWTILGSKSEFEMRLEGITGINRDILSHRLPLSEASISQRMSWASRRKTNRIEDEAYCLMGIFGIHMTTIYGEGNAAFYRLQEEIMKISEDHTLFAWGDYVRLEDIVRHGELQHEDSWIQQGPDVIHNCLLADRPSRFSSSSLVFQPIPVPSAVIGMLSSDSIRDVGSVS